MKWYEKVWEAVKAFGRGCKAVIKEIFTRPFVAMFLASVAVVELS